MGEKESERERERGGGFIQCFLVVVQLMKHDPCKNALQLMPHELPSSCCCIPPPSFQVIYKVVLLIPDINVKDLFGWDNTFWCSVCLISFSIYTNDMKFIQVWVQQTTVMPYCIPYHTTTHYSCLSNSTMKPKILCQSLITWNFH